MHIYEQGRQLPDDGVINALADFAAKRHLFEILLDVVCVVLAYYGAYGLRFDGDIPGEQVSIFKSTLPLVILIQMVIFLRWGIYGGIWRYVGVHDLVMIGKSVFAGGVASSIAVLVLVRQHHPSPAVFVINALLLLVFVMTSRSSCRLLRGVMADHTASQPDVRPVIIYGAGDGGELLIREILNNHDRGYLPVGFIDDYAPKVGNFIHGYRIFDSRELPQLIRTHGVSEVLISSSKVPESRIIDLRAMGLSPKRMSIRLR